MPTTLQDVLNVARIDLNDSEAEEADRRYPDSELIKHCNAALLLIADKRPDVMIGLYSDQSKMPNGARVAGDTFPFEQQFVKPVADIIVSLAQTKDEEMMDSNKVKAMLERALAFVSA